MRLATDYEINQMYFMKHKPVIILEKSPVTLCKQAWRKLSQEKQIQALKDYHEIANLHLKFLNVSEIHQVIEKEFKHFPIGSYFHEIESWFENTYGLSLGNIAMGEHE